MTFRKRLIFAFTIVIVLPVILFIIAFYGIAGYLSSGRGAGEGQESYSNLADGFETSAEEIEKIYDRAMSDYEKDSTVFENKDYLQSLTQNMSRSNSYILVRRDNSIYYTGNEEAGKRDFDQLPPYTGSAMKEGTGLYIDNLTKIARQIDFTFTGGEKGSFFVVTTVISLISKNLLAGMSMAMIAILLITAVLLMRWLEKGIFKPINELNYAMGQIRDGNLEYTMSTDEDGEIGQLYKNYEDMRLRLKDSADEKLEHEKQNRELISNISHDLKTPITSIKGYVEGIMDGVANTPEKQQKYIRTIYNKANDMDRLIDELTLYSRMENDRIPYNFRRLNVSDYFGDCVEELGMDLEAQGIKLNYTNMISPGTVIVADPEQMKRVINNIVSNSVKYMDKPDGHIDFRILDEHDSVRIEIEDNGKGIAPKDIPKIFDRFYRTDSSRHSPQRGSGIGLSIVKKIVEDHGGYIWATSPGEGKGTCMHIVIRKYRETPESSVEIDG